jgi:hypothetical protein
VGDKRDLNRGLITKRERKGLLEDLSLDGKIRLKWVLRKRDKSVDWIDLAEDGDKC